MSLMTSSSAVNRAAETPPLEISKQRMVMRSLLAEDIAHLCCVPDDWRLQISNLAAWPLPTFCAKSLLKQERWPRHQENGPVPYWRRRLARNGAKPPYRYSRTNATRECW